MLGEIYALLSAASFGVAGAAVAKGAPTARGDNGVFLSILITLSLSALLWLMFGTDVSTIDVSRALVIAVGWFVVAGILATVFGRLTNFRSIALAGAIRASLFRRLIPVFSTALAFLLLGETYAPAVLAGMCLIIFSIAMVIWERTPQTAIGFASVTPGQLRFGLLFGSISALCYALAYIARKLAMEHLADAALGALIGALTGVLWYLLASLDSPRYRSALVSVFSSAGPWQWLAAFGMSLGQIFLFFALLTAQVAVVAIIGSLEMFVGAYFAAFLFRSEPVPGRATTMGTIIALLGVVLVALG